MNSFISYTYTLKNDNDKSYFGRVFTQEPVNNDKDLQNIERLIFFKLDDTCVTGVERVIIINIITIPVLRIKPGIDVRLEEHEIVWLANHLEHFDGNALYDNAGRKIMRSIGAELLACRLPD